MFIFKNNVYIIQKERADSKLLFMYKPFVNTILLIAPQSKFLYNDWKNIDFKANDTIIIIGCFFNLNDFINLKNKNLYVIFYFSRVGLNYLYIKIRTNFMPRKYV